MRSKNCDNRFQPQPPPLHACRTYNCPALTEFRYCAKCANVRLTRVATERRQWMGRMLVKLNHLAEDLSTRVETVRNIVRTAGGEEPRTAAGKIKYRLRTEAIERFKAEEAPT